MLEIQNVKEKAILERKRQTLTHDLQVKQATIDELAAENKHLRDFIQQTLSQIHTPAGSLIGISSGAIPPLSPINNSLNYSLEEKKML
jgi:hypothetical protein